MWTCKKCKEENEDNFDTCYKCQTFSEESAKRISRDIEIYKKRDDVREIEESGGSTGDSAVQRGTKDLMRMIRSGIDSETQDIEDVEPNEE